MSALRPGRLFTCAPLTTQTSIPAASRTSHTDIQYTPVASMATLLTPAARSSSRSACSDSVKASKTFTGPLTTATYSRSLPTSMPAACSLIVFSPIACLLPPFRLSRWVRPGTLRTAYAANREDRRPRRRCPPRRLSPHTGATVAQDHSQGRALHAPSSLQSRCAPQRASLPIRDRFIGPPDQTATLVLVSG